jgi:lipopolysaccharide export LptBFGC system permease protein LptF
MLTLAGGNAEYFSKKDVENQDSPSKIISFNELSLSLPIAGVISEQNQFNKKLSHMNINELLYARRHWHSSDESPPTPASIKHDRRLVDTHISHNIAMAFGVLALSLIAVPLGIRANRADASINTAMALIIALGYYFSMVVLSWFGDKTSLHPKLLVWLPNLILGALGIGMLRKSARN